MAKRHKYKVILKINAGYGKLPCRHHDYVYIGNKGKHLMLFSTES